MFYLNNSILFVSYKKLNKNSFIVPLFYKTQKPVMKAGGEPVCGRWGEITLFMLYIHSYFIRIF